eukprot:jgi/Ulvmu1/10563/UM065_0017.1
MHCFDRQTGVWLASADWKSSSDFLAAGTPVRYVNVSGTPAGSLISSACEATSTHLDFTFSVPPSCAIRIKLYFADSTGSNRKVKIFANGDALQDEFDVGATGSGGATLDVDVNSPDTGLLELSLVPGTDSAPAMVSGVQIYAKQECPKSVSKFQETTGETDTADDAAVLVYRMACALLPTTSETITTNLNTADSAFLKQQDAFVAKVGDASSNAELFTDLCLPATDADHLEFNLPLNEDVTYEVALFFAKARSRAWSDIIITVDGHEVFAESREEFSPGPGNTPQYHSKRFEARAGPDGMQIVVSSLNGFPPISGMEVSQVRTKSGATGMTLLDRADDHIVVACGSKVFQQSPGGEILYPGPEAFTSAGLTLTRITTSITPAAPALADLVAGGAFRDVCTAAAGGAITATFHVQSGEEYTVTPYFAETSGRAAVGSRTLFVWVDGAPVASNIDIFKEVGLNAAVSFSGTVTAKSSRMNVTITSSAGTPMISAIAVDGPAVDAAAADRGRVLAGTGLARAAACGAAGYGWAPIEGLAAAGFQKFTTNEDLVGVPSGKAGLYSTHCFAPESEITLQIPVVPSSQLRVVLHFAETVFGLPGKRVFDVYVNGNAQYTDVDLAAEGGYLKPIQKEFTVTPTRPNMIIELKPKVQHPILNGIEIYSRETELEVEEENEVSPPLGPVEAVETPGTAPAVAPVAGAPAADAPVPAAAPTAGTSMVPVQFTVPQGNVACVVPGKLMRIHGAINVDPPSVGFGEVDPAEWQGNAAALRLTNSGQTQQTITHISCTPLDNMSAATIPFFVVQFGDGANAARVKCSGANNPAEVDPPFSVPAGNARPVVSFFEPTSLAEAAVSMSFWNGDTQLGQATMVGVGGNPWEKAHTLHPVVSGDTVFTEPDAMGGSQVIIDGSTSHTHDPSRKLNSYLWEDITSGEVVSKKQVAKCFYPFGTYTMSLTVTDDALEALATTQTVVVAPESQVPGSLTQIYLGATQLQPVPGKPDKAFMTAVPFSAHEADQPETGSFLLRMSGSFYHAGGASSLSIPTAPANTVAGIFIDGTQLPTGEFNLPEGDHFLDVRLLMPSAATIQVQAGGLPIASSFADISTHPPTINELTTDAVAKPDNVGIVKGFLIQEPAVVFVGATQANITVHERTSISFIYPNVAPGEYNITVKRGQLTSNAVSVTVAAASAGVTSGQGGPFADTPKYKQTSVPFNAPARLAWCHGKLYVSGAYANAANSGGLWEFTLDSKYEVVSKREVIPTPMPFDLPAARSAWSILGLACDPRESDDDWKLYFSLSPIFSHDGKYPNVPAPYAGTIYYVKPTDPTPKAVPFIENLSVANGDHVVNGIDFAHDGRLLVAIGSQTNAGMPGALGYLPDNPTSTNILAIDINAPTFTGIVSYAALPGAPANVTADPMDQRNGDWVKQTNPSVTTYATGTRNPYEVSVGKSGNVMVTINGPNFKFGAALTGVDKNFQPQTAPDPETSDAVFVNLKEGCYVGAPNIARCRNGVLNECKYVPMDQLIDSFPTQCKPDTMLPSSIGGITEYNSYAFGGAYLGRLFIAGYKKHVIRFDPETGKDVTDKDDAFYPASAGLDILHAPAGVHIVASMDKGQLLFNVPVDATLVNNGNPSVYDIVPDRGMKAQPGANTFTIGGANFLALTGVPQVLFDGVAAKGVAVAGDEWITGLIPAHPTGTCNTNVTVSDGDVTLTLPNAFCYLA